MKQDAFSERWERLEVTRDADAPEVGIVRLARPEKLNAIDARMHAELQEACARLERDPSVRVVIFTGAGRAFSAGADLGQPARGGRSGFAADALAVREPPLVERDRAVMGARTAEAIERLPQVTIGAVNGLAVGGAVVLLACMDLRVADATAWFSIPEVPLGIPLTWGALPRLLRELGPARTRELVLFGDRFTAEEAWRWGFVNRVVAPGMAFEAARELARRLVSLDPIAVAVTKSEVRALADAMVPASVAHADADLLLLSRALRSRRE